MEGGGDWLMVGLWYLTLALIYGSLLYAAISEVVACIQRRHTKLAADRLLESVPDVPYHQALPDAPPPSCVICIEEYERGESCFVMPPCAHMFHRGCIAHWLRQGKNTCPICRAPAVIPAQQHSVVTTAQDMV